MKVVFKTFDELTTQELYAILKLRADVFVVEQDCVYQDLDNLDQAATHLYFKEEEIMMYARLLPLDTPYKGYVSIGRIVNAKAYRGKGLGHKLMKVAHEFMETHYPNHDIKIAAQEYLHDFYASHGYVQKGERYLWDGIWHIDMVRKR